MADWFAGDGAKRRGVKGRRRIGQWGTSSHSEGDSLAFAAKRGAERGGAERGAERALARTAECRRSNDWRRRGRWRGRVDDRRGEGGWRWHRRRLFACSCTAEAKATLAAKAAAAKAALAALAADAKAAAAEAAAAEATATSKGGCKRLRSGGLWRGGRWRGGRWRGGRWRGGWRCGDGFGGGAPVHQCRRRDVHVTARGG